MRNPDAVAAEIARLDSVLEQFGDPDTLSVHPGARLTRDSLYERRVALLDELANAEMATVALILEGSDLVGDGDVDVSLLVDALSPFQDVVSAIGQAIQSTPTARSAIPAAVRDPTRLRLVGTFRGSMGLALRGPRTDQQTLFEAMGLPDGTGADRPIYEQAVERVIDLLERSRPALDTEHEDSAVVEALAGLGGRVFTHLRRLAGTISSNDARARIVLQRPDRPAKVTVLAKPGADRLQRILSSIEEDEREVKMQGHLVGASLYRDNFELSHDDGTVISGRVHPDTLPFLRNYFDSECTVTLMVRRTRSTVTDVESEKYTLIHITEA